MQDLLDLFKQLVPLAFLVLLFLAFFVLPIIASVAMYKFMKALKTDRQLHFRALTAFAVAATIWILVAMFIFASTLLA